MTSKAKRFQPRAVAATLWEPLPELLFNLKEKYSIKCIHLGAQEETKEGIKHYHAYIRSTKCLSLKAWKLFIGQPKAHIEAVRGTVPAYIAYCNKELHLILCGVKPLNKGKGTTSSL